MDYIFPVSLSTGSAHIKSQKVPLLGIYLNLSIFLISSILNWERITFFISGEIPPWMHKNLLLTKAARGRASNKSMIWSYMDWSYLRRPGFKEYITLLFEIEKSC